MEGRVEDPENLEVSEKSRSLDRQSLSAEKSRAQNGQESGSLKRKNWRTKKIEESGFGLVKKRRRGRKEVSLSSFEVATKKSRGGLDSNTLGLKSNGFALFDKNPVKKRNKDGRSFREQNLQSLSSLNDISHSLDDNAIVIPKRPRGFSGRKKFQGSYAGKQTVNSVLRRAISRPATFSGKSGAEFSRSKLIGDRKEPVRSFIGKRKRILDRLNGSSSARTNSVTQFKSEDDDLDQFPSPAPKRARRNHQKEQMYEGDKQSQEVKRALVENSMNILENLQEDDEENLEQNAARMLSSRFDPSCTGLSGRGAALKSQSADGLSFSPSFDGSFKSLGKDASVGSFKSLGKDASVGSEIAGRVLRPRNKRKHRGLIKRLRRHFYEVCYMDMDPFWVVNQRIKVFWPLDQSWYFGVVKGYDPVAKLHHVKYDDRDEELINLQNERFKLLLLPDEVRARSCPEKPGREGRHMDEVVDVNFMDENCMGNFMESEPIISWLSRSTHQVKSSALAIAKKQKQSCVQKKFSHPIFSDDLALRPDGPIDVGPSSSGTNKLYMSCVVPDRSGVREVAERSFVESGACSSDSKMPLVYFRRRFRNRHLRLENILEKSACRSADGSVTLFASVIDRVGPLDEFNISLQSSSVKDLELMVKDNSLMPLENLMSKFPVSPSKSEVSLKLSLPPLRVFDLAFGAERFWLYSILLLLKYGTMATIWPNVRAEILFVDNIVGLRFMLFEGSLKQAVVFLCHIMAAFHWPKEHGKLEDFQLPVTSIGFKLLGLQDVGRQLEFVFYNFLELKSSKWLHLDGKLKHHCLVTKELPLAECTYANIKTLQSGSEKISLSPSCEVSVSLEKRSRQIITCRNCFSCKFDGKIRRLPPFVLSFAAAPTFFMRLHLNLLIENNIASINLQNHDVLSLRECPETIHKLIGDGVSLVGDSGVLDSETTPENMQCSLSCDAATAGWSSSVSRKENSIAPSVGVGGDWIKTSQEFLHGEIDVSGTTVSCKGAGGKSRSDRNDAGLEIFPFHHGHCRSSGKTCSSAPDSLSFPENSNNGRLSHSDGINVHSSSYVDVEDRPLDQPAHVAKMSVFNLGARNLIDGTICNPNPTAPRSMWHRSRHGSVSSSFGYRSKLWPDFISNDFINGSRKPRTQVSYYNLGSNPRSHRRKGHPYKRINDENVKVSDGSGSPHRYLELLVCDANVLVTVSDRGWRENGAQVVLESVNHKDWTLLVKVSGVVKYSYKAHQFLQPGVTNRFTHAMMWKGGKDWILEFPDRSQWVLFKEMHEECYNRNVRAASVKNIPIPGVCLIEDSDICNVEVPFVRTQKYFRQIGTDVDMAMDPSHVFYDMESDDDEWIVNYKSSSNTNGTNPPEITEEIFEKVMDMFEKIACAQQREDFTSDEIEHFMAGIGPIDAIKAIYDYWQQKRMKKGMPLIRHLQPALWEHYEQQLREWELTLSTANNSSDRCNAKATLIDKPPMFAFCLRPRGLEVPNKGTKQRSQRKFTVLGLGHHGGISRDYDGLFVNYVNGRKLNGFTVGDEKALFVEQNNASSDVSSWLQTSTKLSLRDAAGLGNLSVTGDWSGSNQYRKLQRNRSKKLGMLLSPRESLTAPMPFHQRTTGNRNGVYQWSVGSPECHNLKRYQLDGFQRHRGDQSGGPDLDEFRLRDASGAAQHAANMAKLKRERAHRLLFKADLAMHKAVAALMTAEAIRTSAVREANVEE